MSFSHHLSAERESRVRLNDPPSRVKVANESSGERLSAYRTAFIGVRRYSIVRRSIVGSFGSQWQCEICLVGVIYTV